MSYVNFRCRRDLLFTDKENLQPTPGELNIWSVHDINVVWWGLYERFNPILDTVVKVHCIFELK